MGSEGCRPDRIVIAATYAGDAKFNSAFGSVNYTIDRLTPTISWATPAAITYGTPLSATQLNATASVPGTFAYTPAAGTVLAAGMQTLSVTFTPTDTVDYSPAESMVTLTVNPAPIVAYTLTSSTQSVSGSTSVTLGLTSTNYVGTVSFATSVTSTDGAASNVSASAPSVTLTCGGAGSSVLTITANANAANHVPVAPWTSGGAVMFGAVLLGAPFTASPETDAGCPADGSGNHAGRLLDGLQRGCILNKARADLCRYRDSYGNGHGDKPGTSDHYGDGSVKSCRLK